MDRLFGAKRWDAPLRLAGYRWPASDARAGWPGRHELLTDIGREALPALVLGWLQERVAVSRG